jgi:hypothetical protein
MNLNEIILSMEEDEAREFLSLSEEEFWARWNDRPEPTPDQYPELWAATARNVRRSLVDQIRSAGWLT